MEGRFDRTPFYRHPPPPLPSPPLYFTKSDVLYSDLFNFALQLQCLSRKLFLHNSTTTCRRKSSACSLTLRTKCSLCHPSFSKFSGVLPWTPQAWHAYTTYDLTVFRDEYKSLPLYKSWICPSAPVHSIASYP